jgi:hypothetical protein
MRLCKLRDKSTVGNGIEVDVLGGKRITSLLLFFFSI